MSKRSHQLLLEDMLESARKIKNYCKEHTLESFLDDEKTKDAVARNFEIIGEAANRLSPDFTRQPRSKKDCEDLEIELSKCISE